jgi:hypothetical protein
MRWRWIMLFLPWAMASHRVVLTFENWDVAARPHGISAATVKQYGRRLVLDIGKTYNATEDDAWIRAQLNYTVKIEEDFLVKVEGKDYSDIWMDDLEHQYSFDALSGVVLEDPPTPEGLEPMDWPDYTSTTPLWDMVTTAVVEDAGTGATSSSSGPGPVPWNLADGEPYGLQVESLWRKTNSTPDVVVAVVDSGIAMGAKSAFLNLLDGYDFISDTATAADGDGRDPDSTDFGPVNSICPTPGWHGTKVASVLAAKHTSGVYGVAQNCSVLPIRVLGLCSEGYANDITDAIVWAVGGNINGVPKNPRPARIISLSLAGTGACPSYLQSAINQANAAGAIVVAAAGNEGLPNITNTFPANCQNVISVGARARDGSVASFSNKGASLLAPGVNIPVLNPDVGVTLSSGTSLAVPHIVGSYTCALNQTLFSLKNVEQLSIVKNASNLVQGSGACSGAVCGITNGNCDYRGFLTEDCAWYWCPGGSVVVDPFAHEWRSIIYDGIYMTYGGYHNGYPYYTGGGQGVVCYSGQYYRFWCTNFPGCSSYNTYALGACSSHISVLPNRACYRCDAGKASAAYTTSCEPCPAGTYAPLGSEACYNCPAGKYSGAQWGSCGSCGAGSYAAERSGGCATCPAGTYSGNEWGSCANCPAGQYSGAGAGGCTNCPAGQDSVERSSGCTGCATNYFNPTSGGLCTLCDVCPANQYRINCGGSAAGSCTNCNCPANQYQTGGCSRTTGPSCSGCPANTNGPGGNSPALSTCLAVAGYYGAGSATYCQQGFYCSGGANRQQCPTNTNTAGMGATTITQCLAVAGYYGAGSATPCGTGYYCPGSNTRYACAAGSFSSITTASACTPCTAGSIASSTGLSVCTPCPTGLIAASNGLSVCSPCATGYIAATTGRTACTICAAGSIASSTGLSACAPCAPGTIAAAAGSSVCSTCLPETYMTTQGASACLGCAANCTLTQHMEVQCNATANRVCCDRYVVWETLYTFVRLLWMLWVLCMILSSVVADIWTDDLNLTFAMDGLYEAVEDPPTPENLRAMDWPEYSTTPLWDTEKKLTSSEFFYKTNQSIIKAAATCNAGQYVCGSVCCNCPMGTYGNLVNGHSDPNACTACPVGTYVNFEGHQGFALNFRSPYGSEFPWWYYQGMYNNQPWYSARWGEGYMSLYCDYNYWYYGSVPIYSAYGYRYKINVGGVWTTYACPPFQFSILMDQSATYIAQSKCWWCAANNYCSTTSQNPCPANTNSPKFSSLITHCTANPGYYGIGSATECGTGYYCTGGNSRQICLAGSFSGTTTSSGCTPCAAGSIAASNGLSVCTPCPTGFIAASSGLAACSPCAAGYIAATMGLSVCSICAAGSMSASSGLSMCTICAPGSIAAAAGSSACSTCLPETYITTQGSTACLGCTPACSITQHTEIQCTPSTNRVCCDRLVTYIRGHIPKSCYGSCSCSRSPRRSCVGAPAPKTSTSSCRAPPRRTACASRAV